MYKTKHNEANGENNRDGTNDNHSVNFGHEAPAAIKSSCSNGNAPP